MIVEQKEIKLKGRVVFEKLVIKAAFNREKKYFVKDEACFLYLTKGAFNFRTPVSRLTFREGDAMLAKCGNYFIEKLDTDSSSEKELGMVGAFFYPEIIREIFTSDFNPQSFRSSFDATKTDVTPLLKSFIEGIGFLLDNPAVADEQMVITKLRELLLILSKSKDAASLVEFIGSLFAPHEYRFREIITQNIFSDLSIGELAHLSNMSLATFKRHFRETFGESPARYILQQRLQKVSLLLLSSQISVSDAAFECGFENVPGFNKAFKKQFGLSPSEFRLSQKEK